LLWASSKNKQLKFTSEEELKLSIRRLFFAFLQKLMIYKLCLSAFICASLLASCAKFTGNDSDVVIIDDKPKTNAKNEIVIDDVEFGGGGQENGIVSKTGSQETAKISPDQSRIDTMYDQFGNKTETRCFKNDLRLKCVTLLTAAADGKTKVSVYGQNGEIKSLPAEMLGKAMSAPASEIANSAGIYEIYRQPKPIAESASSRINSPLRPVPSYNFPIETRQVEQNPAEPTNPPTDAASEKTGDGKGGVPPAKSDKDR
jgi:hypothetical protein